MRHLHRVWVPVLAAVISLAACGEEELATETYEVSGRVTENRSGLRIRGARVTFTSDTLISASTTTDGDGIYALLVESETPFGQIRAQKEGYAPTETSVYFDSPVRRLDLVLIRIEE